MTAFTPEDLGIGQDEMNQLVSACANKGITNPVADAIGLGVEQVSLYTAGYALTVETYQRLVRGLAIPHLYWLANGSKRDGDEDSESKVLRELEAIRDGKFPALAKAGETPGSVTAGGGSWGSATKVEMRS